MIELHYPIVGSDQLLIIEPEVLQHMLSHRQLKKKNAEAGGQLFGRFVETNIFISKATGPKVSDFRSRFRFIPNRHSERKEIAELYSENYHFIGDWHTHPQCIPSPSHEDIQSMKDLFTKSTHQLAGMVMIIIGLSDPPEGMHVSICNTDQCHQLRCQEYAVTLHK